MKKRTLEEIEQEIAATKAALADVHGTKTEVYARIVGYYRAVEHWNRGKRDEFDQRKNFSLEASNKQKFEVVETEKATETKVEVAANVNTVEDSVAVTYELYTRKTCPNCPPVKEFMSKLDMEGQKFDVDTKEGLAKAASRGIFASPTVIFFNKDGVETTRCHNVEELQAVFNKVTVVA